MPNGAVAHLSLVPAATPDVIDLPELAELETEIGQVTAQVVGVIGLALIDFWGEGAMTLDTRHLAGEKFAALFLLWQRTSGTIEFSAGQAKIQMAAHDPEGFAQCRQAIDTTLDHVFRILSQVIAVESGVAARPNTWA